MWWSSVALAFPPLPDPPTNPTFDQLDLVQFEMLDLNGTHAAVRVVHRDGFTGGGPPSPPCAYAGMDDPRDGVTLYLVTLATAEARAFDVYPVRRCMAHDQSSGVLAEAKAAFAAVGLDPNRLPIPLEPRQGRFTIPTPKGSVQVRLEQRDRPYAVAAARREVTSELLCGDALAWRSTRWYTIEGVGSATATFPLAYQTAQGVVFVEQWSVGNIGGVFDSFSLTVPLPIGVLQTACDPQAKEPVR